MPFTAAGAEQMLEDHFGARTHYVSLHTANPSDSNELSGNGYARIAMSDVTGSNDSNSGDVTNDDAMTSAVNSHASDDWDDITHVAMNSASTGGTRYHTDALPSTVTIGPGERFRIPAGDYDVSVPIS